MAVMFDVTDPFNVHAMTKRDAIAVVNEWKAIWEAGEAGMRGLLQGVVQEVLQAELTEALQAGKSARSGIALIWRTVKRLGLLCMDPRSPKSLARAEVG